MASESSSAAPATDDTHVAGWLVKQGAIHKTWRKRFFVNTPQDPLILTYYVEEACKTKKGQVVLKDVTSFKVVVENKDKGDKQRTRFTLVGPDRTWLFLANGVASGEYWTNAFNRLVPKKEEGKKPEAASQPATGTPAAATTTTNPPPAQQTAAPTSAPATPGPSGNAPATGTGPELWATAIASYTSQNSNELSFNRGDRLRIIDKEDQDGWWAAELNNQRGWVSSFYLSLDTAPH